MIKTATVGAGIGKRLLPLDVMLLACCAAFAVAILAFFADAARGAANLPAGFTETQVATGLDRPTTMALAPDGRIFVAQQGGKLRVIQNGQLLAEPFVDLSAMVDARGERGLLGVALDPSFASNGYIYLYYTKEKTRTSPPRNQIVRYTASGNRAASGSARLIFSLNKLSAAQNHNGGALNFGRDGKLYVAVGENANPDNSQLMTNVLGKMLRLNKTGTIPRDNPYFRSKRVKGKNKAIWAKGLRNPYTFAVQPGTGRMFINDVGATRWEEINVGGRRANYGWPDFEGPETNRRYVPPIFAYRHDGDPATTGCAITGGTFYNPATSQFPADFVGDYLFADFCSGWIRRYDPATDSATGFATGIQFPVDLDIATDGSLLYLERGTGSVYRVESL